MILLLALPVGVSAAEKPVENSIYYMLSKLNHHKVLDISRKNTRTGGNVQLYDINYGTNQQFVVTYLSNGSYKTMIKHSSKVLDIKGESRNSGANVQQVRDKDTAWQ